MSAMSAPAFACVCSPCRPLAYVGRRTAPAAFPEALRGDRRKAAPTVGSRRRIPGAGAALASPTRSDRFMGKGCRKLWQPSPHVPVPCGPSVDLRKV